MAQIRPAWLFMTVVSVTRSPTPLWLVHCMERVRREMPGGDICGCVESRNVAVSVGLLSASLPPLG